MRDDQTSVWQGHASQWAKVGPPLRPSSEDGELALALALPSLLAGQTTGRVAVLGVTPELVSLPWPEDTDIHAFDQSQHMLETVWQPHPQRRSRVTLARWQALPVPDGCFGAVVGDGSLNALPSLEDYGPVLQELARVTRPHAALVLRCFVRPDDVESIEQLKEAVMAGQVGSFHALKWRLAMALAAEQDGVVAVRSVHQAFGAIFRREDLARHTGWPMAVIDTIDAYRSAETVYTFPTLAQWVRCGEPHWKLESMRRPVSYELADRCPTLRFVRAEALS